MGEEQHCACFETLCLYPDYASSHIDKIFVNKHAHRMLSSLCLLTSSAPAKAAKYIAVSIHWGKYCGHCFKKIVEESCLPN